MESYITIDGWKSNIRFSSAHIIPEYEKCGRLHGHSYAVHIKIVGEPDNKGIIVDFTLLKRTLKEIADKLDHKILIPEKNNIAKIEKQRESVKIVSLNKEYVFPIEDCIFLPISSTSAENLAEYVLDLFLKKIKLPKKVKSIEIGVDEGYGQGAKVTKNL
jgi:6-pyruvoyltetrahydropterin/6-carboxytetrahydropterin synthase